MDELDQNPEQTETERPGPPSRRFDRRTAAIIAAFGLICTWIQFGVRIDYGPDEPYHLEYINTLAFEQRLPEPSETHAVQHPPIYYGLMAVLWRAAGPDQRPLSVKPGPGAQKELDDQSVRARHVLRFASTIFGCLTLLVISRVLVAAGAPESWRPWLLLAVAATPMLQYVSSVVNNEGWAILYSSVVCLEVVKLVRSGTCSARRAALLGLLVGFGALVKQTTLFALPVALWAIWQTGAREERGRRLALFILGVIATGIWWPLHNRLAAGSWFPSYTRPANQPDSPIAFAIANPLSVLDWFRTILETSFLPDFSRPYIPRSFSTVVVALGILAFLWVCVAAFRRMEPEPDRTAAVLSVAAALLLMLGIFQYTLFTDWRAHIGGRYMLNALPWLAAFAAVALPRVLPSREPGAVPKSIPLAVSLFALFDLCFWYLAIQRYEALDIFIKQHGG